MKLRKGNTRTCKQTNTQLNIQLHHKINHAAGLQTRKQTHANCFLYKEDISQTHHTIQYSPDFQRIDLSLRHSDLVQVLITRSSYWSHTYAVPLYLFSPRCDSGSIKCLQFSLSANGTLYRILLLLLLLVVVVMLFFHL